MKNSQKLALTFVAAALLSPATSLAGPALELGKDAKSAPVTLEDKWHFTLALPFFAPTLRGDEGLNGNTSHSVTGFNELINKIDMAGDIRVEAQKGRFGVRLDVSYDSISDGFGVGGVVRKADIQLDQILGDFGVSWRLIEGPKGYLDVIAGTHYTYLYEQLKFQGNDAAISAAANRLALAGTILRAQVAAELAEFSGKDRDRNQERFSRPSPGGDQVDRILRELRNVKGNTADRAARIERVLRKTLNGRANRTDDWFDPYIGFRGRYNINPKLYFIARAEISPFDVGADFGWQASAGFGFQLTRNITYELVYRALDVEYRHDGFIYDITNYGPEGTIAISF